MRLHIISDLHREFAGWTPPEVAADVVVLAGDTDVGKAGVVWAAGAFPGRPVVYVPGNHEYYGEAFPTHLHALRRAAAGTGVHVLDRGTLVLPGLRILGCTLWTDFALDGRRRAAMAHADEVMWDYRQIRIAPRQRRARPTDTARWHRRARAWLAAELVAADGPTVVVTHHAPSRRSVPDRDEDLPYNPAYASALEDLVAASGAALWVHGHTHRARDYRLGTTHVVCNPRGYHDQTDTGFDPGLVLEV